MCGIAGWVAFDRDLTRQRSLVQAMTGTMICRGPDAGGVHLEAHAALGHRRLAVIDLEGGAQPMKVERDGRLLAVMTYSGEVYNFQELRTELAAAGVRFRTRSDTETVLEAYLHWGPSFVERLNGMFAFAIWDARTEELLLVRDRMGVKPLYYYPTSDGVLFGSEPKAILANPEAPAVVSKDGLRELLAFVKTPGHAVYQGMAELKPGHVLRVRRGNLSLQRYWQLTAREHTDDLPTTVATVRELLTDTVRRQLIADVPLCSLLSGGLDSSTVTALAARELAAAGGGPVRSFSVDFQGQQQNFQADAMRASLDGPYAHLVAEHVRADHRDIVLDRSRLTDRANRDAVLRAGDLPTGFGDMDTSLYLLFQEIRRHSTVALSGESADELFGGYPWFHQPEAVAAETFPWLDGSRTLHSSVAEPRLAMIDPGLVAELELDTYIADSYATAMAEVPHLPSASPIERRMREICYLHLTRFVRLLLDRKDRMSMAVGLEVRVPFCDHRLVEYVFNTPWAMKTYDGREKSLLRGAAEGLLPEQVLARVKSPYPSTQDPGYPRAVRDELAELNGDPKSPLHALADPAAVARALAPDRDPARDRTSAELLLALDRWQRLYPGSLAL
ncbi:asparagine synthase (glutamine-hydrolyzing) [Kitasatospora viridis]|uniref:asparagine synthase (glutamine-hydrolyzing) n=1 Tax=Kitasatospora viridis TaxID=281105 RepID=A0A561UPZ2_9ACTN|nr:asparagine synthase (glutamine-hydrolyzing) [Kitasatospora viridis]TWG01394.1 asparagine synthase (glutamine-hydrolysing) [Kitasatospora viridis]